MVHDVEALKDRSAAAWISLFEERMRRNTLAVRIGGLGQEGMGIPFLRDENIVSMYEGGTNLFWAERYGKQIGVEDLWVKLCGNSHTGSFKDLGMTVLVSVVKQMIAERPPDPRRGLRVHRRHFGGAGRLLRGRGDPGDRARCRATRSRPPSSCSPSPTARSCSRSTPTSTAA